MLFRITLVVLLRLVIHVKMTSFEPRRLPFSGTSPVIIGPSWMTSSKVALLMVPVLELAADMFNVKLPALAVLGIDTTTGIDFSSPEESRYEALREVQDELMPLVVKKSYQDSFGCF